MTDPTPTSPSAEPTGPPADPATQRAQAAPASASTTPPPSYRSKTLTAWLALLLGALGLHRFYLHGLGDRWGWLFPLPTFLGLLGLQRMDRFGQDDRLARLLVPLLGLTISIAMLSAIVHALTPDEKWDARFHGGQAVTETGWGPVLAAIFALLIGGGVLMGTIAFTGQKFFEWQLEQARAGAAPVATATPVGDDAALAACRPSATRTEAAFACRPASETRGGGLGGQLGGGAHALHGAPKLARPGLPV
jgi:hypothetical protein